MDGNGLSGIRCRDATGEHKGAAMADLLRTGLHDLHVELGAKMVPFAGYEMPVQYPMGVLKEHLHTRAAAGLFDVSHMGQVILSAPGGVPAAALALEALVPVDIAGLAEGRQRYAIICSSWSTRPARRPISRICARIGALR